MVVGAHAISDHVAANDGAPEKIQGMKACALPHPVSQDNPLPASIQPQPLELGFEGCRDWRSGQLMKLISRWMTTGLWKREKTRTTCRWRRADCCPAATASETATALARWYARQSMTANRGCVQVAQECEFETVLGVDQVLHRLRPGQCRRPGQHGPGAQARRVQAELHAYKFATVFFRVHCSGSDDVDQDFPKVTEHESGQQKVKQVAAYTRGPDPES